MTRTRNLLRELARRRVLQTVGGYIAVVWLLAQGFADLFPAFGLPDWLVPAFVVTAVALLPVVALASWRYNLTLRGIVRDTRDAPLSAANGGEAPTLHGTSRHSDVAGFVALTWEDGTGRIHTRQIFSPVVLGRDMSCDIHITDRRVSRRHSQIAGEDGRWIVKDLDSVNGTWIDGERITSRPLPRRGTLRLDRDGPAVRFSVETDESTLVSRHDTSRAAR